MPLDNIDAKGNVTHTIYDQTGIFPSMVQKASTGGQQHFEYYSVDSNTGLLSSYVDENGSSPTDSAHMTRFNYDTSGRRIAEHRPDGGATTFCYTDVGGSGCTKAGPPFVKYTYLTQTSTSNIVTAETYDGLGRRTTAILQSDPFGAVTTDTTYDGAGRVQSTSNPYRSPIEATAGTTTFIYDALGRLTREALPDGNYKQWCHDGKATTGQTNCRPAAGLPVIATWVDVSDEAGQTHQEKLDALGRLIAVIEPDPITNQMALETDYSYDSLGNLHTVNQQGTSGETGRTRNFSYDSLSHLKQSYNPETGYICYGTVPGGSVPNGSNCTPDYDPNGNLLAKTDARGITANYGYDSLNRLVTKWYTGETNPTLSTCYQYDAGTVSVPNSIGRLVSEWTQPGNCPPGTSPNLDAAVSFRNITAYDAMGRVVNEQQCALAPCATSNPLQFAYDLAGDLTYSSNGLSNAQSPQIGLTSSYDGAGRIATETSSWDDPTHPPELFKADALINGVAPYGPFGLTAAQLGFNTTNNSAALSEAITYDIRGRVNGKVVLGAASTTVTATTAVLSMASTSFTATDTPQVSVQVSCNSACGSVTFKVDGADLETVGLDAGGAYNISPQVIPILSIGAHTLTVQYLGNAAYAPATSNSITFTVVSVGTMATTTTLSIIPSSVIATNPASASVHVGCNSACGFVDFKEDNGLEWGTVPLDASGNTGGSTASLPNLSVGTHTGVVQYLGNATYAPSTSPTVSFTILPAGATVPTMAPNISATSFAASDPAIVSIHVGCGATCGSIDYREDNSDWATVPLDANGNSSAPTWYAPDQSVGPHTVFFQYLGDPTYAPSTSNTLNFTILPPGTTPTTATATITSTSFSASDPASVTVNVGCNSTCGWVDFIEDGREWGRVQLDNFGSFTSATSFSPNQSPGPHTAVIHYLGNATYAPATSNTINFTITQ
jgi:YD repeat-containing protein